MLPEMGSTEVQPVEQADGPTPPRGEGLTFNVALRTAALAAKYHRASASGLEHVPRHGPALIVANHGIFGFDTPVFFFLVYQATGRIPIGMADRILVRLAPMRAVLHEIGGVEGTRRNALSLLRQDQLVVCYPGGAREVFKGPGQRHRLAWEKATGFARVAAEAQVPVLPVAAHGVDDTFRVVGNLSTLAKLLGHQKYRVPLALGVGPLPLPARFRFDIGPAVAPPPPGAGPDALESFRAEVQARIARQLALRERFERDG